MRLLIRTIFFFVLLIILLGGCQSTRKFISNNNGQLALTPLPQNNVDPVALPEPCVSLDNIQTQQTYTFKLLSEDIELIQQVALTNEVDVQEWNRDTSMVASQNGVYGWASFFRFERADVAYLPGKINPILLQSKGTTAYFMVRNGWSLPHAVRLIVLLDFQRITIDIGEGNKKPYYDFGVLQPQEDAGISFAIPALTPGFHQLSLLLIADPESTSIDPDYRLAQRLSFAEARYDLWVDSTSLPLSIPSFADTDLGQAAASKIQAVDIVANDKPQDEPLLSLDHSLNDQLCLPLHLYNVNDDMNQIFTKPTPLRLIVAWDDVATQIFDYDLPVDAPDFLVLPIKITPPMEVGEHQLQVMLFTFPGYSQFIEGGEQRTGFPIGVSTQRLLVNIKP